MNHVVIVIAMLVVAPTAPARSGGAPPVRPSQTLALSFRVPLAPPVPVWQSFGTCAQRDDFLRLRRPCAGGATTGQLGNASPDTCFPFAACPPRSGGQAAKGKGKFSGGLTLAVQSWPHRGKPGGDLAIFQLHAATLAADTVPDPAVTAGREALQENSNAPWYDAESDDVRRLNVAPPPQPQQPTQASTGGSDGRFLSYLMWGLVVLALAVLAWLMIRAFMLREQRLAARHSTVEVTGTQADRVEELPIPVRRPSGDLLSEARFHYEQGNFREAIVYLYSHELLELDKHQMIHLARGKTNRQYLREITSRQRLRELLEQTMVAFEDAFFGQLEISRQRFEACWHRVTDFNALLAGPAA